MHRLFLIVLTVRDCFEFIELAAYLLGFGLLLPVVNLIGRDSLWSVAFVVLLVLPFPAYVARIRFPFPQRLDEALERFAYLILLAGIVFLPGVILMHAARGILPSGN